MEPPTKSTPGVSDDILLTVRDVVKSFPVRTGGLRKELKVVLSGVSLEVRRGEIVALVGESGSGKSTLARCVAGLHPIDSGEIEFHVGVERSAATSRRVRTDVQYVFQDAGSALDPRWPIGRSILEGLDLPTEVRRNRLISALTSVGIDPDRHGENPHQFSGGQLQRIGIARALVREPGLLVADEIVSALDVSVQAQILDLLTRVREEREMAILFITHDLAVASQISNRIYVMSEGQFVESGPTGAVLGSPMDAYTRRLIASVPGDHPNRKKILADVVGDSQ